MKTYLKFAIIFASIISPTWADDFSCEVKLGPDNTIYVDVQNTSNSDIVIMGGRDEKLVVFGILYYPVLDEGTPKIITIGENLGMYEIPDLIFLPAKYTRRFQVDLPGLKDIKQMMRRILFAALTRRRHSFPIRLRTIGCARRSADGRGRRCDSV